MRFFYLKGIFVLFDTIKTSLFSISFTFLLYQTIPQIYHISDLFLSSHTPSYLLPSSQLLFYTKHTLSVVSLMSYFFD